MGFYCNGKYASDEEFDGKAVIRAIDRHTGEHVAIKRWRAGSTEAENEISVWRRLYPKLFMESCADGEFKYLVRKWIDGCALTVLSAVSGGFTESDMLTLFYKIVSALENFYEASGMVYGDLKPENIIVNGPEVTLIDYETAAAALSHEDVGDKRLNSVKTVRFASRAYSAPETYHGDLTMRSDIYSLGMIFLFLLGGSPERGIAKQLRREYADFCNMCIAGDPLERYADIKEVKSVISGFLSDDRLRKKDVCELNAISVENMNVKAENINYNIPVHKCESEEVKKARIFRKERSGADMENHGRSGRIVMFPRQMTGYRRLIIYIPNNLSFAAELAYMSARLFGMKVSVFEISDYFDGDTKYYLSLDKTIHDGECYEEPDVSEDFVYASEESSDEKESDEKIFLGDSEIWRKKGLMALCEGVSTLYISLRDIVSELELRENGIRNFSVWCYSNFDITVISDTSRLDTERMAAFMRYSDYIMVPVETDIDKIAFEKRFFTQFMRSMSIPLSKLKYVGWEFSELHSVEHEAMIKSLGENAYLGTVGYDVQRKSVKNLKGQFYCESAAPWLRAQYGHIINNFMFNDMKTA